MIFSGKIVIVGFLLAIGIVSAADLEREARLYEEVIDAILDGNPVELSASGHNFLGIYTASEENSSRRAALILHGRGMHPNWSNVVQPLRVGLVGQGWNTLSIQLPVLGKQTKYNDYVPLFPDAAVRIRAAVKYLREQDNTTVVLIAHSCGFHMANHWLLEDIGAAASIDGLVGIGMGATDYQQPMQAPFALAGLDIPVLDIYGENDYPAVVRLAEQRKSSHRIVVPDADHFFTDKGEQLLKAVGTWLEQTKF